jgi:hypothetical protein
MNQCINSGYGSRKCGLIVVVMIENRTGRSLATLKRWRSRGYYARPQLKALKVAALEPD